MTASTLEAPRNRVQLGRPPRNPDELHAIVKAFWGVNLPRVHVCEDHVPPFEAFAHAYFSDTPNYAMWYASRGSGKSYMLAILALTKAILLDMDVTLLGGSMAQSENVHEHVKNLLAQPGAPRHVITKAIDSEVRTINGTTIRPLPASQKTVRGPHPNMTLLDEIDEMDYDIYSAAMGQAMSKTNSRGEVIPEYVVASSTWQNPQGTFTKLKEQAEREGLPVYAFCYRENLKPHGWMDPEFIERKRSVVPAEMFRVEYELGEPSGTSRAFDMDAVDRNFVEMDEVENSVKVGDELYIFEEPVLDGVYAAGADWAKEEDWTVIVVLRTDTKPARCVYFRRMQRRPYPYMIDQFSHAVRTYQASAYHDATGLGNVVHDLIEESTSVRKMVMVGRDRVQMLTDFIANFEHDAYTLPRQTRAYHEFRYCSVDDIYNTGTSSRAHLPDTVAAFALAHRAHERMAAPPHRGAGVPKDPTPRKVDARFYSVPEVAGLESQPDLTGRSSGDVRVIPDMDGVEVIRF